MRLYIELDQRSGWTTQQQIVEIMKVQEGVAVGRSEDGLAMLRKLKMLDTRIENGVEQLKISSYGVQWFEKSCPMISREPVYEFSLPTFRSIKLVGPDEFYGRKKITEGSAGEHPRWTKWGAMAALVALPIPFIIWWLS